MMKIIAIVGQSGSGKTQAGEHIEKEFGIKLFNSSDVIVEEAKRRNISTDKFSLAKLADTLREEKNHAFASQKTLDKIKSENLSVAVIAGLRSPEEVDYLRNEVDEFILIWVDSEPGLRYERRRERQLTEDEFFARDEDDLKSKHVGKVLLMADRKVINNGSEEELFGNIDRVLMDTGFV